MNLNSQYVYLWVHKNSKCSIEIKNNLVDFVVEKLPIYIGRGSGNRKDAHKNNKIQTYLSNLIQNDEAECVIIKDNLSFREAVYIESYVITTVGTIKKGTGPLHNISGGVYLPTEVPAITKNNLELNTLYLLLDSLNSNRTIKQAAKELGVSERSLYRYMNSYKIEPYIDDLGNKIYEQILEENC